MADEHDEKTKPAPKVEREAPPKREIKPLAESSFHPAGVKQNGWEVLVPAGTLPEDVLQRDYWAHVALRNLRDMAKIVIMCEDRSWYGEVVVFQSFTNGALVKFIFPPVVMGRIEVIREETEFETFDGGLIKKWCVKRLRDGRVLHDGFETRAEADTWLRDWLKSQGASSRKAA